MVMDVNWTYCGDHFVIYTSVEPLCCTPETNITLYVNFISIKRKKKKILIRNNQMEEMNRACYVRRGAEFPCLFQVCHAPSTCTWSPTQKISESHTSGIFIKALSHRHDHLLTRSPEPLPSVEDGGGEVEHSKLLIMAWSFQ